MRKVVLILTLFFFSFAQANGIWSGWHGLCQKGKDDGNWDWLSDPYVLASYAISAYAGSAGAEANAASTTANQTVTTSEKALSQAMQSGINGAGVDQALTNVSTAQATALTAQATAKTINYAVCAARAGLDVAHMVSEYKDDGEPCDPVDEICDEEAATDSEIYTIPEKDYNDIISGNSTEDMTKYIKLLSGQGSGIVTIKIINPGMDTGLNKNDMAAAKEALQKIKKIILALRASIMSIQLAYCLGSNGGGGGMTGSMAASLTSPQNLGNMAVSFYNPFAGIAFDAAMNTVESMKNIDTCNNKDDANKKGSRHIATLESNQHGMCHFIESVESGSKPFSDKTKYRYCCYDDKITRILVEQAKAQLLKDWQHCADMTVAELQYLKFKSCTPEDRTYGVDGVKLNGYATIDQRANAYQHKRGCIDSEEFVNYMISTFGGKDMLLDDRQIKEQFDLMKVD